MTSSEGRVNWFSGLCVLYLDMVELSSKGEYRCLVVSAGFCLFFGTAVGSCNVFSYDTMPLSIKKNPNLQSDICLQVSERAVM